MAKSKQFHVETQHDEHVLRYSGMKWYRQYRKVACLSDAVRHGQETKLQPVDDRNVYAELETEHKAWLAMPTPVTRHHYKFYDSSMSGY